MSQITHPPDTPVIDSPDAGEHLHPQSQDGSTLNQEHLPLTPSTPSIDTQVISKRQQKKQQRTEQYYAQLEEQRRIKREKDKIKRQQKHQEYLTFREKNPDVFVTEPITGKQMRIDREFPYRYRTRHHWQNLAQLQARPGTITIAFDCQYDDIMHVKEIHSLATQLQLAYATNIRALQPIRLYLTGVQSTDVLQDVLTKRQCDGWDGVKITSKHYFSLFNGATDTTPPRFPSELMIQKTHASNCPAMVTKVVSSSSTSPSASTSSSSLRPHTSDIPEQNDMDIVQLDSDSTTTTTTTTDITTSPPRPNPYEDGFIHPSDADKTIIYLSDQGEEELEELSADHIYIIGGIVDHNRIKGISQQEASRRGVRTMRLPLDQYISHGKRKVLTTLNVFQLLLARQHRQWAALLGTLLPERWDFTPISNDEVNEHYQESIKHIVNSIASNGDGAVHDDDEPVSHHDIVAIPPTVGDAKDTME